MDLDLDVKVFVVSGGTSGLGAAVAAGLVGEGARVVICSRSSRRVSEAVSTLGEQAVGLAADLRDATTPRRLIERARRSSGRLDGAFVSHGGPDPGPATDLDDARLRRAMESAVVAPIAVIREIVRELPSGGAVVALTSSTGVEPMVGMAASNVARAAVHGYVKTIATEVATRGVRVNVLIPGPSPRLLCFYCSLTVLSRDFADTEVVAGSSPMAWRGWVFRWKRSCLRCSPAGCR